MSGPTAPRPLGVRLVSVAGWVLVAVLAVVVVRRYVPDYDLPDLGPAPDVVHATFDGAPTGPGRYPDRIVVLNVWATWCPPCVVETPGFVDLAAEFEGEVQFLGLSVDDDPADIRAFAERHGVPYPLLVGPPLSGAMPNAPVLPTTLVIDRAGRVRLRHEGLLLEPALRPILRTLAREPAPRLSSDFPS